MSEKIDPSNVPLLFPDPVTEFYLEKVDRAAIREQLKKTPGERLEWLEKKMRAEKSPTLQEEPWPVRKSKIDTGEDPSWSAEAKAIPLLFPDPVVEAYMKDVDRGLIRQALRLSVSERFERFSRLMRSAYELRRACRNDSAS